MRYETHTVRVGERVGDVDWMYDFRSHFNNLCSSDELRDEACAVSVARLRRISDALRDRIEIRATTYGGWPRCGWNLVLDVGMYDGWPYWRPVPSVLMAGTLGGAEWHSFDSLTDCEEPTVTAGAR